MQEKKRSKKPYILGTLGVLLVAVIAFFVYIQQENKQKEEMWAFRDTLDKTYFPVRDEFEACVYPSKTTSKKYDCYQQELQDRNQKARERISNYEVSSDDAKKLKNDVLNGIDIIDKTTEDLNTSHRLTTIKGKLATKQVRQIAINAGDLEDDKTAFFKNAKQVYNIFVPKYYGN